MEPPIYTPEKLPAPVAQQVFVIGSGIAGGLAGFYLAKRFIGIQEVSFPSVIGATLVSAIFTFGAAAMLAKSVEEAH